MVGQMKTIRQKHHIPALPEEVFIALTNPFTIELWTGYPAEMSIVPGSEFSLFEGDIVGKNLQFKASELIKQQWYFEGEEKDSIVTLRLKPEKKNTIVLPDRPSSASSFKMSPTSLSITLIRS